MFCFLHILLRGCKVNNIPVRVYTEELSKYWPLIVKVLSIACLKLEHVLGSSNRYELQEGTKQDLRYFITMISQMLRSKSHATFAICDELREGGGSLTHAVYLGYGLLRRHVRGIKRCDLLIHIGRCSILLMEYSKQRRKGERIDVPLQQVKNVYDLYVQLRERRMLRRWLEEVGLSIKVNLDSDVMQEDFKKHGGLAIIVARFLRRDFEEKLYHGLLVLKRPRRGGRLIPHKNPYILFIKTDELSSLEDYF